MKKLIILLLLSFPLQADVLTEKEGGLNCKFFTKSLKLEKEVTVYWRDLLEITTDSMIFSYGDDEIVIITPSDPNPWICVPIEDKA